MWRGVDGVELWEVNERLDFEMGKIDFVRTEEEGLKTAAAVAEAADIFSGGEQK